MPEQNGAHKRRSTLPPLAPSSAEQARALQQARAQRDAAIRGVSSIEDMRADIRRTAAAYPAFVEVPRVSRLDAAGFRARAMLGRPFVITGVVDRWPLAAFTVQTLREQFAGLPVRARVGDYVTTAFAPDRAMADMSMGEYLDLADSGAGELPPYLGNLELRDLNRFCHWPGYFDKMGPPRFWIGPARTVTPLHCDFDDNIFAQIRGTKRIFLAPPHHDEFLYTHAASALLFGSPFDPETPDYERFPLARQASLVEVIMAPGEMLYVPAGWYHQVRAITFSLSANRWARGLPLALHSPQLHKGEPDS